MDGWMDHVRRIALEVSEARQWKGTLACTSFDPNTHTVKGIILPHGVETGWIPLAAVQTSGGSANGTGSYFGPTPGDASALQNGGQFQGDQLDVEFDRGDPNTLIAKHKMSLPQNPPMVQSGEHLVTHERGSTHLYKQDGSVVFTHFAAQGTHTWDAQGNLTTDTKGKTHTINSSGGDIHISSGGGTIHMNDS